MYGNSFVLYFLIIKVPTIAQNKNLIKKVNYIRSIFKKLSDSRLFTET